MAKKILIVNEGYSSNLGDQAINASMEKLMQSLGFVTDFCYFTNPQLQALPAYAYESVQHSPKGFFSSLKKKTASLFSVFIYARYYFNLRRQIKTKLQSQQYDKVIIGGGQLINSSEKRSISFFAITLFIWASEIKKTPVLPLYLIAVGVAGRFHTIEKYLYKKALKNVTAIWVRDRFSAKSISGFFNITPGLVPDIAFFEPVGFQQYKKENTALVGIYSYDEYKSKFSVAEKNKEAYYEYWKAVVQKFIKEGKRVSLFYTTVTDAAETLLFKKYLDEEKINTSVASVSSLADLNKLFETSGFVYSARMHALILALKKGCNVEAYIISQKLQSFTDEYIKPDTDLQKMSDQLYHTFETAFKTS